MVGRWHRARTAYRVIIVICSHQKQKESLTAADSSDLGSDQSASPGPHVLATRSGYYCTYACVRALLLSAFFRKGKNEMFRFI